MSKNRYEVSVRRLGTQGSQARSGRLSVQIDTTRTDAGHAFDPVQMLLASIGGSLLASLELVASFLKFEMNGVHVLVRAVLSDSAPIRIAAIEYVLAIDTEEVDSRLEMVFENAVENTLVLAAIDPRIDVRGSVRPMRPGD